MRQIAAILTAAAVCLTATGIPSPAGAEDFQYRSPASVEKELKTIAGQGTATLHQLTKTPGGNDLTLLQLGKKGSDLPAIMVVANMEGNCPIATEAALKLASNLVGDWQAELDSHRWYIIACGNPDGYARFFDKPAAESFVNGLAVNDDNDDAVSEDGPDDLNGDGYITKMRQAHPEGKWIAVTDHPVLLKKADEGKGEKGVWRLFDEGIDNDGDGTINEDGPGGANPGRNFPHNFEHYQSANGRWPVSEVESRAILGFAFDHPEIAMVLTFGRTNSLKSVPEATKKAEAAGGKYKVPERMAGWLGLDPETEYPIDELLEVARDATGWKELTEDQLLQWLGVGAAVNPDKKDVPYWTEISKRYNDFIKDEAELEGERLDPPGFSDGCIEEWAYYQYGVPTFSMDFWTLPKPKKEEKKEEGELSADDIEKMSNEDFIALGEEKIAEMLKKSGAPAQFTATMVIKGLEAGQMDTKTIAKYMKKSKDKEEGGGADATEEALYAFDSTTFVPWKSYNHPTLGKVEIGGPVAYRTLTPPAGQVVELVDKQLPFVQKLASLLPTVGIKDVKVERKSAGVWKVEAWIANNGFLPFPTHQGKRCQRPLPTIVTLAGSSVEFLEGKERSTLGLLDGSGGTQKLSWLLQVPDGQTVTVEARTFSAGGEKRTITLTEGGGR
ncbi:MAG TPA: M14 family zinc carboxypeptidase [Acidobacteriota bacterium]|nr:M14 family zinc carboxypeptidase [Acidobacteriota bacterium]